MNRLNTRSFLTLPLCCPYRALTGGRQQNTWKALDSGKHSQNDSARYGSCTNGLLAPLVKKHHHTTIRVQLTTVFWPFGDRLAGHLDPQSSANPGQFYRKSLLSGDFMITTLRKALASPDLKGLTALRLFLTKTSRRSRAYDFHLSGVSSACPAIQAIPAILTCS